MANFTARYPGQGGGGSGSGVTSLNSETGAITLTAGIGIAITTPTSTTIQIASTSSGDVTIGAFGSTPNANGLSISGSQVLNMQPADGTNPGGVSIAAQTFAGAKTFTGVVGISNGSVSAPGLAFSGDLNNGLYYVGTDQWALTAGSQAALEVRKSTGAFANVGMGGSASTSDSYPLLIQRSNASVGTYAQISNPATDASSKATFQLATDLGANTGELSVFTAATATHAYAGSLVLRPADSTLRLSLIGGDLATGYVTSYTGGDYTSTGETLRQNADHTNQFMQSVAAPTSPAAGLKFYNNSGVFSSKTTGGTVSSFTGVNTGDQAAGNLTDVGTDGIVITGGTGAVLGSGTSIAQHVASASFNGYLSSTDWSTFNNKGAGSVTSVALAVPAASLFGVSGSPVTTTGTLTLTTTGTSGGIPYFSSTSALSSSGLLAQNGIVLGGGAATTPTTLATNASTAFALISGGTNTAPSWGTLALGGGGTGATTKAGAFDALSPMTTGGDIIYGGASGTGTRLANGSSGQFLKSNGTTTAPTWASISTTKPTFQSFTSGSGTYTTPASTAWIRVSLVGGGGGGGGTGSGAGTGSTGGNTTFGSSLLQGSGGVGGDASANGGAGGAASLGGATGIALAGGTGAQSDASIATLSTQGGSGAASYFGGQGKGGAGGGGNTGGAGTANTGGGGGGGGGNGSVTAAGGGGGGSGGVVLSLIISPSATYSYAVGAGGAGGTIGTSGSTGGAGGSGIILVEEFYV